VTPGERHFYAVVAEGEPGIGKTTVWKAGLEVAKAQGSVVLSCRPVEAEVKLAFAALADLLAPVVDAGLDDLPAPQREALEVALLRAAAGQSQARAAQNLPQTYRRTFSSAARPERGA
jgi:AAA ATPase domain